ncbi:hypothetical protein KOW79_002117 [Hemibagrus wyckioides]|uniref:Uncharacterized protein n=1 Tax=Hemibagrus wyckioides TaxID=337641 RepID=A0A9D3SSP7_9TELE|nr:hypothetical protein KOW79_002117 [Hemibagrus wyckioides]
MHNAQLKCGNHAGRNPEVSLLLRSESLLASVFNLHLNSVTVGCSTPERNVIGRFSPTIIDGFIKKWARRGNYEGEAE